MGNGTGTLTSGGPGTIEWTFFDAGPGGANDYAGLTIKNSAGTTVFESGSFSPLPFPGSTQPNGNNTIQNIPSAQPGWWDGRVGYSASPMASSASLRSVYSTTLAALPSRSVKR